jgi:hypothetical protein
MTPKQQGVSTHIAAASGGSWDRRKFVLACSAAPFASCLPMESFATSETRSSPTASGQATLQHLLNPDEINILWHASLAPSGHNTQPWKVHVVEPAHWVIGTDKQHWLPAVDPMNRETTLSIGAFLENLILAAERLGYRVEYQVIANTTIESRLIDQRLRKTNVTEYPIARLGARRTVRNGYVNESIKSADIQTITDASTDFMYFQRDTKPARYLPDNTIEANRKQAFRDAAQEELAYWIRWSKKGQARLRNGIRRNRSRHRVVRHQKLGGNCDR